MSKGKKRCVICGRWYMPDKRARGRQACCGSAGCKKERKRRTDAGWQARHPAYGQSRRLKVRSWAAGYPDYWQGYRQSHPGYRSRDNRRRQAAHNRAKSAAKQVEISTIAVERLAGIPLCEGANAAKQVVMDRRVDAVVAYLLWREGAAKQAEMAVHPASVP